MDPVCKKVDDFTTIKGSAIFTSHNRTDGLQLANMSK